MRPAESVLLRGTSKGESTARFVRTADPRQTVYICRQHIQAYLADNASTEIMDAMTLVLRLAAAVTVITLAGATGAMGSA
jgi:hypothetical protein